MKVPLDKLVHPRVARVTKVVRKFFLMFNLNRFFQRPKGQRESVMKFLKFCFVAAVFAVLVACGGGGSGLPPKLPQDVPKGVWNVAVKDYLVQEGQSVARATINWSSTASSTGVTVGDDSGRVYASGPSGPTTIDVPVGTITLYIYNGDGSKISDPLTLSGACVGGTPPNASGVCTAPVAWWPPATITPMGVKVFDANQLPTGCNNWADHCWRDAVANGTVKFVATTATGQNPRPIVLAYFRNTSTAFGVTGLWNLLPIYADDGSLATNDIFGGGSSEVDWVVGNANGAISHEKSTGLCFELYYFPAGFTWSTRQVACPL